MGGKNWSEEENKTLQELLEQGLGAQQIQTSGKLPNRTYEAIRKQIKTQALSQAKTRTTVEVIQPAQDTMKIEEVVKLFSTALTQICQTEAVDKLALERFRIIFQAAKDYAPLLAGYEKWDKIEKQLNELTSTVAQLQAAKNIPKA